MEEKYPIMSEGELIGELSVSRDGLMTVFDADCRMQEGLIRLSVYGGGQEGYIGVMAPVDGRLKITKSLSPNAMKSMPGTIEEAAFSGRDQESEAGENETEPVPEPPSEPEEEEKIEEPPVSMEDTLWYPSSDGALVSYDGDKSLIAFPKGDTRVPDYITPIEKTIEGIEYWVYITQDGRIIN